MSMHSLSILDVDRLRNDATFLPHSPGSTRPATRRFTRTLVAARPSTIRWLSTLLAILGLGLVGCHREKAAEQTSNVVRVVSADPFESAAHSVRSDYIAMLKGDVETTLSFKVGGVIELIGPQTQQDWQEGTPVRKGQVLARLKQEDFVSQVNSARARAEQDALSHAREVKLRATGAVSQQELEAANAAREASAASLAMAEQALRDSVLVAPFDATIAARSANQGETVAAGKPVLQLADLRQMSVELGVPDRAVSKIRVGSQFPVRVSTLEATRFTGRVSEVGVAAKEGARLFRVVIKVPNPDGLLRSGMTASVTLADPSEAPLGSVLIPMSALLSASPGKATNPHQLAVFVVDASSQARERLVQTEDLVRSSVIVSAGLQAGERVVTAGASTLYDGAPVDARSAE